MALRFTVSLESDIGSFKIVLRDRKNGEITIYEDELFNNALVNAHSHYKEIMLEERGPKKRYVKHKNW